MCSGKSGFGGLGGFLEQALADPAEAVHEQLRAAQPQGLQQRGMPAGIIYSPEEVAADPHFEARHWARSVEHPELGRTVRYTGLPVTFPATPAGPLRPAPKLAERA